MLKHEGVEAWNEWRRGHLSLRPDLDDADFARADLQGVDFAGANLKGANLAGADLTAGNLSEADLRGAKLSGATLFGSNLGPSVISGHYEGKKSNAGYIRAALRGSDLSGATLADASLIWVNLRAAKLIGTDISYSTMNGVDFGDVDLSDCRGLDTVKHKGPSSIGIDTIYRSSGNIPEVFLRGCGVPEDFINFMKSLGGKPLEFYSCFISYSSKDQEFAERLHADLREKNVRCWFAPEDLKIGDKLRPSFDEAIRVHDKLMVLLSKSSVSSPWVEKEVETAFEKEHREKRTVLFPIRLDDTVMETGKAWAADIRRTRHIGDFRDWKNHDSYKKAFERLLRDLKA
jgi:uncharacterized protein YjbI with pentapeptide repeats